MNKKVLIYCRESRDDNFENYERIETQRDILLKYCKNKQIGTVVKIILDDNKSGSNFDRLDKVKDLVLAKKIDIILAKDSSRIGRNILDSLLFIEFLENNNIELIFESESYDEDIFPLLAWFNERRAKEDSEKIKRVLRHKMQEGKMLVKASYGYKKLENNLIVDKRVSFIVDECFKLFLSGKSFNAIASLFNKKNYPTPSELRARHENIKYTKIWNSQHIRRILTHPVYTGDMLYSVYEKQSYKSKKIIYKGFDNCILHKDHHKAIITKDVFNKVQKIISNNKNLKELDKNPFSSLLFCGNCGSRLVRKKRKNSKTTFVCQEYDRKGKSVCDAHRISESFLYEKVENEIYSLLMNFDISKIKVHDSSNFNKLEVKENIEKLNQKLKIIYNDRLDGIISKSFYLEKTKEINKQIEIEKNRISPNKALLLSSHEIFDDIKNYAINRATLALLFEKIVIYEEKDLVEKFPEFEKNKTLVFYKKY